MSDVRFGLVGCGRIGSTADERVRTWAVADLWLPYSHGSAIAATPGATLAATCDVDKEAASAAMVRHGASAAYSDFEEMLETEQLDALSIATRTPGRVDLIRAALSHGIKGLYCEKPLSNTLEEADELAAKIDAAGIPFIYGTKRRFMPLYHRVRGRLEVGEIGEITSISVRFGFGPLLWSLPHAADIAAFFAGDSPVESVTAELQIDPAAVSGDRVDADPSLHSAVIRFANGIRAVLLPGEGMDVQVVGREGLVTIEADGATIRWRRRLADGSDIGWLLDETVDPRDPPSSGTQLGMAALVSAIRDGTDPGYGIRHALASQEVLFAMVESHLAGGAPISFPLRRRGLTITGRSGTLYA